MARLALTLLGGFRARLDAGPPVALPSRKAQALLAYLAMPLGQAHSRDELASLLWGRMRQPQARASLRQPLTAIRRFLGGVDALRVDAETVGLDPGAVAVDALTFEQCARGDMVEALERAAALDQGDLLAGLALDEAPFEEWLLAERERLHELALGARARLLARQRAAGSTEAAVESALRRLALDPLQEPVHRALMRLYVEAVWRSRSRAGAFPATSRRRRWRTARRSPSPRSSRCARSRRGAISGSALCSAARELLVAARTHLMRASELFAALGLAPQRGEAEARMPRLAG